MKKIKPILNPWSVLGLSLFLGLCFCFVAMQFYKLQIIEHGVWTKKADKQQQMQLDLGAKRGTIFATLETGQQKEDVPIIQDTQTFHLYVDSKAVPLRYKEELATWLSHVLTKDKSSILNELLKNSRFRKLQWHLDIDEKKRIEKGFRQFIKKKPIPKNALFFLSGYKRVYPLGTLAGSLLQTLGTQEGLRGPERVASGGLEKRLDSFLKGQPGQLACFRTPKGRLDTMKVLKKPQNGCDVYLTLHPLIQSIVETELEKAVKKAKAKGGWSIVLDPSNGHVLAMAQVPSLDLLQPEVLLQDKTKSTYLNMKALTDPFEPGSIMKPFTMLVCLKANRELKQKGLLPIFFPEEKTSCLDGRFPGRKNPIKDVHAYHFLNMDMALQKSSNVYMAKAIQKVTAALGETFYAEQLQKVFGFGQKTNLNIGPESRGFVPFPKRKTSKGLLEWSTPTPFSLSMGYNLLATSMQMVRAFCLIANGGYDVQPKLIKKIIKKNDQGLDEILFDESLSNKKKQVLIHADDAKRITHAMQFAVNKGGTAFRAKIPGFTACGKTATTEKLVGGAYSKEKHISTFVGFAPMEKPKFVCLIVIDEPEKFYIEGVGQNQYGGVCAAPSFSIIGQKVLEIFGIAPDDPLSLGDPKLSKTSQDLKKLEDLFKQWNH